MRKNIDLNEEVIDNLKLIAIYEKTTIKELIQDLCKDVAKLAKLSSKETKIIQKIVPTDKVDDFHLQTNLILEEYKQEVTSLRA